MTLSKDSGDGLVVSSDAQVGGTLIADKVLYNNMFANESEIPSASAYHGMFAHVHSTGKGYFSHGGNWHKLVDETTAADMSETLTISKASGNGLVVSSDAEIGGTLIADKVLYNNMFANENELPSASTYHGMFAHVHSTGKGYFSHSGSWHKLLDAVSYTHLRAHET